MKQSRVMSLIEAVANVVVGYGVAVVTQILIFPIFGLHTTLAQNLKMGLIFTVVSIGRSYALRRFFEAIRMRCAKPRTMSSPVRILRSDGIVAEMLPELINSGLSQQCQFVVEFVAGRRVSGLARPNPCINFPNIEVDPIRGEGAKDDIDTFKKCIEASPLGVSPLCRPKRRATAVR